MFNLDGRLPPILQLPSELRLHIYGYVMGNRVVHVRMTWKGICIPAGFAYACLDDTRPLLEPHESLLLSHAVPFGPDFHSLNNICHQIHGETAPLPFTSYTWAFETAFTLDNWVSMKSQIPDQFKNAIRTVAVPSPGPFRSSERILWNLQEVLLIGSFSPRHVTVEGEESTDTPNRAILSLRKDRASNTWIRSGERIRDLKGAFETTGSGNSV